MKKVELKPYNLKYMSRFLLQTEEAKNSIYVNSGLAILSFLEGFRLISGDETYLAVMSQDTSFKAADLVDMDTLDIPSKYALGKTLANFAIAVNSQGKRNLSEFFVDQAITYFKEEIGPTSIALASLYNNKAVIAQANGRYIEAEDYFFKI